MADWDGELPPIMKEKLAAIGDVGPEERQRMRGLYKVLESARLSLFLKNEQRLGVKTEG